MQKGFLAAVRADVNRLEELRHRIEDLHERAVDDLDALETAEAEDDGAESAYLLAISVSINQATDECVAFDAHFREKYGGEKSDGAKLY